MQRSVFLYGIVSAAAAASMPARSLTLNELESQSGGRLGVYVLNTHNGQTLTHRADERFLMCSTFKVLAVGAVLHEVDTGRLQLAHRINYSQRDVLEYAPVTKAHVSNGMTIAELCAAAIEYSDNTAANLLLRAIGGPKGVTAYARSLGDGITRLDRIEPQLNEVVNGKPWDTTSPRAMARDLQKLLLGDALSESSKTLLTQWLVASKLGLNLIRAGLPSGWRAGDKTGLGGAHNAHGDSDTRNDIAIVWPPHRPPLIVAVYLTKCTLPAAQRDEILAGVGNAVASVTSREPFVSLIPR